MKNTIIILLLLTNFISYCQILDGSIQYGIIITDDPDFDKGPAEEFLKVAKESTHYLSCTLIFNEQQSVFFIDEMMDINQSNISMAIAFSGVSGKYYNIKKTSLLLREFEEEGFGKIILQSQYNYNWELLNESKKIDGLTCFKASRIMTIDNGDAGVFNRTITAWYCPSIPVPYGPAGEGGLPGLILELHNRNVILGVRKIDLNPNKKNVITLPTKGKWLSEKEYSKMLDDIINED